MKNNKTLGKDLWEAGINDFSLVKLFGCDMPVEPSIFESLDSRVKWLGKFEEGKNFCTSCGTLTPNNLTSHHVGCCHYRTEVETRIQLDYDNKLRGTEKQRKSPMNVEVHNGKLLISVGIDSLAHSASYHRNWEDNWKVTDSLELAKDVVFGLRGTDDSEGVLIWVFDKALSNTFENGTLGINFGEQ